MSAAVAMLGRRFYTDVPPQARTLEQDKPTLLVSWWCTGFAVTIILFRLGGRFIRVERLIREDKVMAIALIPLLFRMALVHVVLIWGTNNTITTGLSREDIYRREIGSRLVLVARIMYAATLWTEKFSVTETLNRLVSHMPRLLYERIVVVLRWFLLVTFLGVVGATLGECQPLTKAWQVIPDPGPQCRLAYAQLATMGTANVITDLILVMLPIPIILQSIMTVRRKISLVLLFGLSLAPVATTLFRIPTLVDRGGSQQYRSLCASFEILIATAASNALALGSFVRDRGPKKNRFKFGSVSDTLSRPSTRRDGRMTATGDSDEDLVRSVGMSLDPGPDRPAVERAEVAHVARGASVTVVPASRIRSKQLPPIPPPGHPGRGTPPDRLGRGTPPDWPLASPRMCGGAFAPITRDVFEPTNTEVTEPTATNPTETERETQRNASVSEASTSTSSRGERVSFYDVGGLLEDGRGARSMTTTPIIDLYASGPPTRSSTPKLYVPTRPAQPMTQRQQGPGSKVFLQDIGGLLSREDSSDLSTTNREGPAMREIRHYRDPQSRISASASPSAAAAAPSRRLSPLPTRQEESASATARQKEELRTAEEEEEEDDDDDDGPPYQPLSGNPVRPRRRQASEISSTNYSRAHLHGSQPLRDVGGLLSQDVHPVR